MPWTVYILRCSDDTLYTGITKDLGARIKTHNAGKGAKYTRGRGPVNVMWSEDGLDEGGARKKEIEIKKLSRSEKIQLFKK
ncbi:GIY-YIG nuclease family protein [Candidatus Uhrbacteria bacterium]|jgi:putative endonuclease|nr:GIY-YIG nuclease family protein [Candidatus Uhrbacteria bacterium]